MFVIQCFVNIGGVPEYELTRIAPVVPGFVTEYMGSYERQLVWDAANARDGGKGKDVCMDRLIEWWLVLSVWIYVYLDGWMNGSVRMGWLVFPIQYRSALKFDCTHALMRVLVHIYMR